MLPTPDFPDKDVATIEVSNEDALVSAAKPLTPAVLSIVHETPEDLSDGRPCNVLAPCKSRVDSDNLK